METLFKQIINLKLVNQHLLIGIIILFMMSATMQAQNNKRDLKPEDYELWGTLYMDKLSKNGNWVSYKMHYNLVSDTLYIKNREGNKEYRFATSEVGAFCGENYYAFKELSNTLKVIDLHSSEVKEVKHVEMFEFSKNEKYLITLHNEKEQKWLTIRDSGGKTIKTIDNVISFNSNPFTGDIAIYISEPNHQRVILLSMENLNKQELIVEEKEGIFTRFVWQEEGENVAFFHQINDFRNNKMNNRVFYYKPKTKNRFVFEGDVRGNYDSPMRVSDPNQSRLTISDDGEKVFLGVEKTNENEILKTDIPQIWNGNAITVYSEKKYVDVWKNLPNLIMWKPLDNSILELSSSERPILFFNGDYEYCISYGLDEIGPQYKLSPDVNYYVTELSTGKTKLWLANQSTTMSTMSVSPTGKYIAYYRDNNYWIYEFKTDTHIKLTDKLSLNFEEDYMGIMGNYGIAGWTNHDKELVFYDKYDLWSLDIEKKQAKRITEGHKSETTYRIVDPTNSLKRRTFQREKGKLIDLNQPILFNSVTGKDSSYRIRNHKGKWTIIDCGEFAVSKIQKATHSNTYTYVIQRYDSSPTIRIKNMSWDKPMDVFQSNSIQNQFHWGHSELIEYQNSYGDILKAILYYPANYDPNKKYPMVVEIYEKQSHQLHSYINPTQNNMIGFNTTNFTTNGYFVLKPDIIFKRNNPGSSATDCTISATRVVVDKGLVDENRVGLIGHSFGGYETNFIITETDFFTAAVSGAGIADIAFFYHSIDEITGAPEIFRFENQQWRMDKPLYEDIEGYLRNSPVIQAKKVKTPILIWTGEKDNQVNYNQSVAYYLALRRMKKDLILLVYPDETHVISRPHYQKDLSCRIQEWFDYYLKNSKPKDWIRNGIE